jgi:DNA-binding response OmpR family regulator
LVEDNVLLGSSLKQGMEELGWSVDLAVDGAAGLTLARQARHDVAVLDWMLPELSGIDLVRRLRAQQARMPVIMTTAKVAVEDRIEGLDAGADDYLVKPFAFGELVARVNALHRRAGGRGATAITIGGLTVDLATHRATLAGKPLDLTGKEFDLLAALAADAERLVRREQLLAALYGDAEGPESNSLDVLLARVRKKLDGGDVGIATVRGKGFVLGVAAPPA